MRVNALFLLAATACSSASEPTASCAPGERVEVVASPDVAPRFTWSPNCIAYRLEVYPTGSETVTWWTEGSVSSGVRYGELPPGATGSAAQPLVPGTAYTVAVIRRGSDAESYYYETIGQQEFVQGRQRPGNVLEETS